MTGNELLTHNIMYLLDTWNDEGEINDNDYIKFSDIAENGTQKQKLDLWYNLVGSHFNFDE